MPTSERVTGACVLSDVDAPAPGNDPVPAMPEDPDADDPLAAVGSVARWRFVHDEPEERGGGSVAGEFLLRSDGVLLRRYGYSYTNLDGYTWQFSDWKVVSWWRGTADPERAIRAEAPGLRPGEGRGSPVMELR